MGLTFDTVLYIKYIKRAFFWPAGDSPKTARRSGGSDLGGTGKTPTS